MKIYQLMVVAGLVFATSLPFASADTKMATSISCPVCHMPMTTKMTSVNTEALMVHGKKYYCCSMCAAGKSAAKYNKSHPGKTFVAEK